MCSKWKRNFATPNEFWNLEKVIECLQACVVRAQVNLPSFNVEVSQLKFSQYLGFYSLLALVKVYVMVADYSKAYELFSTISSKYLIVYSKCGGKV
jgi:hypothetical protein